MEHHSTLSFRKDIKATPVVPFQEYVATCPTCGSTIRFELGARAYEKTAGCSCFPVLAECGSAGVYFCEAQGHRG